MAVNSIDLKYAAAVGDLAKVRSLIESGADPNSADESGSGTLLGIRTSKFPILLGENEELVNPGTCLLYTSPSPRDLSTSRMPSSA